MSDGAPFIDPELIAAGQPLKSHGLAALNPASSPIADVRAMQDPSRWVDKHNGMQPTQPG